MVAEPRFLEGAAFSWILFLFRATRRRPAERDIVLKSRGGDAVSASVAIQKQCADSEPTGMFGVFR